MAAPKTMLMQSWIVISLILFSHLAIYAEGFADWMVKDFCSRTLVAGQVIMNNKAENSDERRIRVYRGNTELSSGDAYVPTETLTVSISDPKDQYVYEVSPNAKFERGGCNGQRIADRPKVTLHLPDIGKGSVEIVAGKLYIPIELAEVLFVSLKLISSSKSTVAVAYFMLYHNTQPGQKATRR
jgi:hypothetical protein